MYILRKWTAKGVIGSQSEIKLGTLTLFHPLVKKLMCELLGPEFFSIGTLLSPIWWTALQYQKSKGKDGTQMSQGARAKYESCQIDNMLWKFPSRNQTVLDQFHLWFPSTTMSLPSGIALMRGNLSFKTYPSKKTLVIGLHTLTPCWRKLISYSASYDSVNTINGYFFRA